MSGKRIKQLISKLKSSGLSEGQMSMITELMDIAVDEQNKTIVALDEALALNEVLLENPTFH